MMKALVMQKKRRRWAYLILSVFLLLFLGLIYAWSVFRVPLEQEFGWSKSGTSLTFSISMIMFCLGGLISGVLTARKGMRTTLILAVVLLASGFGLASQITSLMGIYLTYGGMAGLGVGLGYNAVISTIMRWFPDKQGLVSGIALMGFGFGAMILGTAGASLIGLVGWRMTFLLIAASYAVVIALAIVILRPPDADFTAALSESLPKGKAAREEIGWQDMLRRRSFWLFFLWAILLSAAGLSIINISAGYAGTFVGGDLTQAAAIAGVISIANGAGRVLSGQLFDSKGYKVTMYTVSVFYLAAAAALAGADVSHSLVVLLAAFILTGLAYGACPPTGSAFAASFYGSQNYGMNFSIVNLNLIGASTIGPMFANGAPMTAFIIIAILAVIGAVITTAIRR